MQFDKEEKKQLRKSVLSKRDSLPIELRQRADMAMADRIIGHQWFYRAEVLLGFVNYGSEISTIEILQEAIRKGKKVFLPKIEGDEMFFYLVNNLMELQEGYKGIREPLGDTECFDYDTYKDHRILLLMPGVAFDKYGNRMGYGKGYYDKFLKDISAYKIGVCYSFQLLDTIPALKHDVKMDMIITENRIWKRENIL